jgi:hypothetical protein
LRLAGGGVLRFAAAAAAAAGKRNATRPGGYRRAIFISAIYIVDGASHQS